VILADALGKKPGSLGRLLPGSAPIALVRCDLAARRPLRDDRGGLVRADRGEPGLLVVRAVDDDGDDPPGNVVTSAFAPGDRWIVSNDVLREDDDGDYWFVDSLSGFVATANGAVSTREVEDALYVLPEIETAAAWGEDGALVAVVASREPLTAARLAEATADLPPHGRPCRVRWVPGIALTDGFRPRKRDLGEDAARAR
jgi:putative long chain acyl-CoA synthase